MNLYMNSEHFKVQKKSLRQIVRPDLKEESSLKNRKICHAGRNSGWHVGPVLVIWMFMTLLFASKSFSQSTSLNGYLQGRFTDDYREVTGFSIRRAKLWALGQAPVPGNWFYKVQGIFRYQNEGSFTLQDVYGEYRPGLGYLRLGQMVPDFSLQRSQPDYDIPVVERAGVVNALIPSAETGARDIGVQAHIQPANKIIQVSAGMFNGNGGNRAGNEDRKFLFTHRLHFLFSLPKGMEADFGYSLAFRQSSGLAFPKIYGNKFLFHGNDFRWGLEFFLRHSKWAVQSEYIEAHLGARKASGYYLLADYGFTPKNQLVGSLEEYKDLDPATSDAPWYILGFNHYIAGNKAKIMLDSRVQFARRRTNYQSIIQFQLFFN